MARSSLNFAGAGVTVTDDAGNDRIDVTILGPAAPVDTSLGSVSGTQTINFTDSVYDMVVRLQLTGNVTLNFTNVPVLARCSIRALQASTGGPYTLTLQLDSGGGVVRWDGGVAHVLSTAASAIDRIVWERSSVAIECNTVGKAYA